MTFLESRAPDARKTCSSGFACERRLLLLCTVSCIGRGGGVNTFLFPTSQFFDIIIDHGWAIKYQRINHDLEIDALIHARDHFEYVSCSYRAYSVLTAYVVCFESWMLEPAIEENALYNRR
ncbi:hypothetical protein BDW67DRAFT_61929 [Aspergillus spinulosporus]